MKKIGIATIHDIYNYGSILQAYATQRAVEKMGYDCEIINYRYPNEYHQRKGSLLNVLKSNFLFRVNAFLKNKLPGRKYDTYVKNYNDFKSKYYNLSPMRYSNLDELKNFPPKYDIYLSGSDQIWRPEFVKNDDCFFLNFVEGVKKISYGSSFSSTNIPEEYKETYKKFLNDYSHLGVREASGVSIIKNLTGKDAELVLDPTLLLSKKEWESVLKEFNSEQPYILCYGQNFGDSYMERLAKYLIKEKYPNHKILRLNGKFYDYFNNKMEFVLDAGPAEFLGIFKNASIVLAQSFHATVFSILFEKEFVSILRGSENHDTRQLNLLSLLGLNERKVFIGEDFNKIDVLEKKIDYSVVNTVLGLEKEKSLNYLKKSLEA